MENKKKKKSAWPVIAAIIVVIEFLDGLFSEDLSEEAVSMIVFAIVVIVLVFILVKLVRTRAAARAETERPAAARHAVRSQPSVQTHRAFPEPEAYCVVCDHTGEDHFQRDKALRIAQLDDWLKNGIIDRSEYHVLKERYERDM